MEFPSEALDECHQCGAGSLGVAVEDGRRQPVGLLDGEARAGQGSAETPDTLGVGVAGRPVLVGLVAPRLGVGQGHAGHSHQNKAVNQLHDVILSLGSLEGLYVVDI